VAFAGCSQLVWVEQLGGTQSMHLLIIKFS